MQKRVSDIIEENKNLQKKLKEIQSASAKSDIDTLINNAKQINGVNLVTFSHENIQDEVLRDIAQSIIDKKENTIVVFSNVNTENEKLSFLCMVAKNLVSKYNAGKIVKEVAIVTGGNGGGKPNMAMAGGKDISKISDALDKAEELIKNM